MAGELPAEVLTQIFALASHEDLIFQHALPTTLAESSWFEHISGDWALRTPQEAANLLMRESYRSKKAFMLTCRQWHGAAHELMFKCLFFNSPTKLFDLCKILESSAQATTVTSSHGWWTRRLHVCRYSTREFKERGISNEDMQRAFVLIISHCPNLEIFHVDWPMQEAFGPVADALMTFSKRSLRTVAWNVPSHSLAKVVWALDSLKYLVAVHVEFEGSNGDPEEEEVNLGSAFELQLTLKNLRQLSIRGHSRVFLEQATGWLMPSLRVLSIDSGISTNDVPDVLGFIDQHGDFLEFLDLDTAHQVNVPRILDHCPQLNTFTFNADWRITSNNDVESEIVNRPRPTIKTIGLHGLTHAFGVGLAAATSNLAHSRMYQRWNDMNMVALNKRNFPNLRRIRALNKTMLNDLNTSGRPSQELGGMERWIRWWDRCTVAGIRLEDCTGQKLGYLPPKADEESSDSDSDDESDVSEEEEEDDEDEEEEEDDDEEEEGEESSGDENGGEEDEGGAWNIRIPALPVENSGARSAELRQLLEECRIMGAQREDNDMFPMMMGMGMGMMGGPSANMGHPSEALSAFQKHYGTSALDD